MELLPGQVLSHFRVLEKAGEGGMGVVYRARDLHLDRDVALKVISGHANETAERRFRKEASALSRLNHPNVASIFDFDACDGTTFIVMEWIPGRTLDSVFAGKPADEKTLINIGEQICAALAYAHAQGVIHRDLKPGNLRLGTDGRMKVLDFGLAKLWKSTSDESATVTIPGTRQVIGTLPYIAPELLTGSPAHIGSDIYALGAILYEAATGKRAFPQLDSEALTAAILHSAPVPPRRINASVSEGLEHVIMRALDKNPENRYASALDLKSDLQRVRDGLPILRSHRWMVSRRGWQIAAAIGAVLALSLLGLVNRRPAHQMPTMKGLATTYVDEWSPQISPDREWISYLSDRGQKPTLWLQRVKGGDPIQLSVDEGITSPVWSPDGENVAFLIIRMGGISLRIIPPFGGRPATTFQLPDDFHDAHLVRWIGSNIYLELRGVALYRVDARNGRVEKVMDNKAAEGLRMYVDVRPDEKQVVYQVRRGRQMTIWTAALDGSQAVQITADDSNDFSPRYAGAQGEEIFYSSDRAGQADLWRMTLRPNAEARQITFSPAIEYVKDVSSDRSLIAYLELREASNVWRTNVATGEHRQVTSDALRDAWPTLSAAANRLVIQRQKPMMAWTGRLYSAQILMSPLDAGASRRVWTPLSEGGGAKLSPDGKLVTFVHSSGDVHELHVRDVDLSREWTVTNELKVSRLYPFPQEWNRINFSWSANGSELLFVERSGEAEQIAFTRSEGHRETLVPPRKGVALFDITLSPTGDDLAFVSAPETGDGTSEIRILARNTGETNVVWSMEHTWKESVFLRGWIDDRTLLAVRATFNDDWSERMIVLAIGLDGKERVLASLPRSYAGTARFDPRRQTLYVTAVSEGHTHNIVALPLSGGQARHVTVNELPGISFGAVELDDAGNLLYVRQEINQDIWTISFAQPQAE